MKIKVKKTQNQQTPLELKIDYLNVLIQEYSHRDTQMWKLNFKFFFASLVVMLLPSISERLQISIPNLFNSAKWIFPAFGILLAFLFLYVSLGDAKRFKAISQRYDFIAKSLPEDINRRPLKEVDNLDILNYSTAYLLPILMSSGLIILGILMIIDSLL